MLVWNFVKRLAVKIGKTIAQVKHELLSDYLLQDLKKPTIKFRAIFHLIDVFYLCFNYGNCLDAIALDFSVLAELCVSPVIIKVVPERFFYLLRQLRM
ncbi:hypothetical protein D5R40_27030 [Okeania hirsuta]|uniref:Uncharacterized protein n=1 Tax=Okeania hirsuta TaxID=1458930 RepID=A0A3N6P398_9CYAN|nr:hypothetical protein D4Z78_13600 [Okeania hirsuta]RQH27583.1 hypothetical protein D5R40_27030 [Okeania hirsuta]